ncbi:unnamed protein product, partial [Rotaria sp. Silwood1]
KQPIVHIPPPLFDASPPLLDATPPLSNIKQISKIVNCTALPDFDQESAPFVSSISGRKRFFSSV